MAISASRFVMRPPTNEGSFATWLTRLTRNLLIDHYRRTRNERVTDSIEEQLPRVEEGFVSISRPDAALAGREASELLQGALAKLSPELAGNHHPAAICRRWNTGRSLRCWAFPKGP